MGQTRLAVPSSWGSGGVRGDYDDNSWLHALLFEKANGRANLLNRRRSSEKAQSIVKTMLINPGIRLVIPVGSELTGPETARRTIPVEREGP